METQSLEVSDGNPQREGVGEMSVQAVVDRKRKIVEVMNAVMVEGDHYGRIPGCGEKPSLFKSGAEVLATTFNLAPRFVVIQTDLPGNHREYRVTCTLVHIATGANCGEGVGTCSTMESKYRYRGGARKCPECGRETIIQGKKEFGGGWLCFAKRGGCGAKWPTGSEAIESQSVGKIENPDPADQYNTILKMAKKRAQVDATLTSVGASDLLTQDLEDLPQAPQAAQAAPPILMPQAAAPRPPQDPQDAPGSKEAATQAPRPPQATRRHPDNDSGAIVVILDQVRKKGDEFRIYGKNGMEFVTISEPIALAAKALAQSGKGAHIEYSKIGEGTYQACSIEAFAPGK